MTIYSNNIPQSDDRPSDSQNDLLQNFQALKVFLDRNHNAIVDPTANSIEGKHKFLQMPEQSSAPSTAANEGGLYTKEASGITNLFWRQESSGTQVQMTNVAPSLATNGYTFLPGGILIQWGRVTANATSTVVSFPLVFTTVYQCTCTLTNSGSAFLDRKWNMSAPSNAGFNFYIENTLTTGLCSYIAIGRYV